MTAYNLKPPDTLPSLAWQEKKEKRKQVLVAVRQRRRMLYQKLQQYKKTMKPAISND